MFGSVNGFFIDMRTESRTRRLCSAIDIMRKGYGMTDQELFDRVATHLLTQGEQSFDEGIGCAYRGENGKKCAIGCLIPDEWYSEDLEGNTVHQKVIREAAGIAESQLQLADALQACHDCGLVSEWRDTLRQIATGFGLSAACLDEVPA